MKVLVNLRSPASKYAKWWRRKKKEEILGIIEFIQNLPTAAPEEKEKIIRFIKKNFPYFFRKQDENTEM